jgi:hypothetical protein
MVKWWSASGSVQKASTLSGSLRDLSNKVERNFISLVIKSKEKGGSILASYLRWGIFIASSGE